MFSGRVLCSSANELQQISSASSREDYIPQTLTVCFVAFCLLSVNRKQWLQQCNYSVDQSAVLTGFYVISVEFLSLSCRRSSARNVPNGEERREMDVFAG